MNKGEIKSRYKEEKDAKKLARWEWWLVFFADLLLVVAFITVVALMLDGLM